MDRADLKLSVPDPSLVVLIGPSGSGKSTFAAKHFRPTEVISSDECRALVSDDENDQAATPGAFRVVHTIARERLRMGRLTVVDATNVSAESRRPLITLARKRGVPVVAIMLDLPEEVCRQRNRGRRQRTLPDDVIRRQRDEMKRSTSGLGSEGFQHVYVLGSIEAVEAAVIVRRP